MASDDDKKKTDDKGDDQKKTEESKTAEDKKTSEEDDDDAVPGTPSNKRRFFPRVKHLLTREWEYVSSTKLRIYCSPLRPGTTLTSLLSFLFLVRFG